jgi:hypothetical protein
VAFGRDPHLMPVVVDRSTPTAERTIALDNLEPGTRYYFRVETATPLGVARSAVLSFRTADASVPQPQPEPVPIAPAAKPAAKPVAKTAVRPAPKASKPRPVAKGPTRHRTVRTASR